MKNINYFKTLTQQFVVLENKIKEFNAAFGLTTYNEDYKTMKKLVKYDNNSKYSGPVFVFPAIYGTFIKTKKLSDLLEVSSYLNNF